MFTYEKSVTGKADIEKVWELYSDVTQWNSPPSMVTVCVIVTPFVSSFKRCPNVTVIGPSPL